MIDLQGPRRREYFPNVVAKGLDVEKMQNGVKKCKKKHYGKFGEELMLD